MVSHWRSPGTLKAGASVVDFHQLMPIFTAEKFGAEEFSLST